MSKLMGAIQQNRDSILRVWLNDLKSAVRRRDLITEHELELQACVLAATSSLVFPANHAASVTTVTYPIQFSPNN